jgi:hypothetical protein
MFLDEFIAIKTYLYQLFVYQFLYFIISTVIEKKVKNHPFYGKVYFSNKKNTVLYFQQ